MIQKISTDKNMNNEEDESKLRNLKYNYELKDNNKKYENIPVHYENGPITQPTPNIAVLMVCKE